MPDAHLATLARVLLGAALAAAPIWLVPSAAPLRPWSPGEPLPVLRALIRPAAVEEDARTGLVVAADAAPAEVVAVEAPPLTPDEVQAAIAEANEVGHAPEPSPTAAAPEVRPPPAEPVPSPHGAGFVQPVEDPGHRGLAAWHLALMSADTRVVRAVHFGDSTIAADGIARTVRARLQARFGAGGPGFVSAAMDPRWNRRYDITVRRSGAWDTKSLYEGGAAGRRYGLGGTVATAEAGAGVTIDALDGAGDPVLLHHVELWTQGPAWARVGDHPLDLVITPGDGPDRYLSIDLDGTSARLRYGPSGRPVPFYGVVLEGDHGATWEALGVTGIGSGAFGRQHPAHLTDQLQRRNPDLLVVMLGGNDAGLRGLDRGDGTAYRAYYEAGLRRLRDPLPDAACLLISPVDQAIRRGGTVVTKAAIPTIVQTQREIAADFGCAFWSAYDAMGGSGSFGVWLKRKLAWTDLAHLSTKGQEIVGEILADALIADHERFVAGPACVPVGACE